jgi:hypothetical protein
MFIFPCVFNTENNWHKLINVLVYENIFLKSVYEILVKKETYFCPTWLDAHIRIFLIHMKLT